MLGAAEIPHPVTGDMLPYWCINGRRIRYVTAKAVNEDAKYDPNSYQLACSTVTKARNVQNRILAGQKISKHGESVCRHSWGYPEGSCGGNMGFQDPSGE